MVKYSLRVLLILKDIINELIAYQAPDLKSSGFILGDSNKVTSRHGKYSVYNFILLALLCGVVYVHTLFIVREIESPCNHVRLAEQYEVIFQEIVFSPHK